MHLENTLDAAKIDRRQFIIQTAATAGLLASGCSRDTKPGKDLDARIRSFRKLEDYFSFSEYADSLGISPLAVEDRVERLLVQPDLVNYTKEVSLQNIIPAYLLAAIVAEENTPNGLVDMMFHKLGERIKSSLGFDTSIGIANVKMGIAAYYLGKIDKPSQENFNRLSKEEREEVKRELEDPRTNLAIAARHLGSLRTAFLRWNERYLEQDKRVTQEEFDANPLAMLQIANGYNGGESVLDRSPNDKAKRVLAVLGYRRLFELYDGDRYYKKLEALKGSKRQENFYRANLSKVQQLLSNGIELRDGKKFADGYRSISDAIEIAQSNANDAQNRNLPSLEIEFLAYVAYSHAAAGKLLINARSHNRKVITDSHGDYGAASVHYQSALEIYKMIESKGADIGKLFVKPKPIWGEIPLPPRADIEGIIADLRLNNPLN